MSSSRGQIHKPQHHRRSPDTKLQSEPEIESSSAEFVEDLAVSPSTLSQSAGLPLTPADVMRLQRIHGNQYVQRVLQGRVEGQQTPPVTASPLNLTNSIQPKLIVKRSAQQLLDSYKIDQSEHYSRATTAGIDDTMLMAEFDKLIQSSDSYYVNEVHDIVNRVVERQSAPPPPTAHEVRVGNIKISVTNLETVVQNGLLMTQNGQDHSIKAQQVDFKANLLIEGGAAEQAQWKVGIVQTVVSADRRIVYTDANGKKRMTRISIDGPKRDGREDNRMPWYDMYSDQALKGRETDSITAALDDQPGFGWTANVGDTLDRLQGLDTFKTCLIVQKLDGTQTHYLHTWQWHIDYDSRDLTLGAALDVNAAGGDGSNLVMDGTRARKAIKVEERDLTMAERELLQGAALPSKAAFIEMKKNAKSKFTPRSGQLPVKKYGTFVMDYAAFTNNAQWTEARQLLTELKQYLDVMDQAQKYWKNDTLKQLYFTPIYQAVTAQQTAIQNN